MHNRGAWLILLAALVLLALVPSAHEQAAKSVASAQAQTQSMQRPGKETKASGETTLRGCLHGDRFLAVDSGKIYRLRGDTSPLMNHDGQEVLLLGRKAARNPRFPDEPVVEFIRLEKVFSRPPEKLNPAVSDASHWRKHTNKKYGIKFAVPGTFPALDPSRVLQGPQFVNQQGVVTLASFGIPQETYSGADFTFGPGYRPRTFAGGSFAIYVNPEITDQWLCQKFENPEPSSLSSLKVGGVEYSGFVGGGVAAGTGYDNHAFHTFQDGSCYEVGIDVAIENPAYYDLGCMVPVLSPQQEHELILKILSQISFFRPDR